MTTPLHKLPKAIQAFILGEITAFDAKNKLRNYTVEQLNELKAQYPEQTAYLHGRSNERGI